MKNKEIPFIKNMFDLIAPRYDFLNHFLSLYQDTIWRKIAARSLMLSKKDKSEVLDVACGTADLAIEIAEQYPNSTIRGVDFSESMLRLGEEKVLKKKLEERIKLQPANALDLPFEDNSFDAISIAFGIRNIQDRRKVLKEFLRCLKPGGKLAILELTSPESLFLKKLYLLYFQKVLPFVGGLFSSNFAYNYLPDSVLAFPETRKFLKIIEEAGFENTSFKSLSLGVCTLYLAEKTE